MTVGVAAVLRRNSYGRRLLVAKLFAVELRVEPRGSEQLVVCTELDNSPALQHDDAIGLTNRRKTMCDDETRALVASSGMRIFGSSRWRAQWRAFAARRPIDDSRAPPRPSHSRRAIVIAPRRSRASASEFLAFSPTERCDPQHATTRQTRCVRAMHGAIRPTLA